MIVLAVSKTAVPLEAVLSVVAGRALTLLLMGRHVSLLSVEGLSHLTVAASRPPTGHRPILSTSSVNGSLNYQIPASLSTSVLTPQSMDSLITLQLHV